MNLLAFKIETLSRLLLAVVVSVSILQTPIPMAHAHSGLENRGLLGAHLLRHHCDQKCQDEAIGHDAVHWHLCLPGQSDDPNESDQDRGPAPCRPERAFDAGLEVDWAPLVSDWVPADLLGGPPVLAATDMLRRPVLSGPYALTSPNRTCALLCVIRC